MFNQPVVSTNMINWLKKDKTEANTFKANKVGLYKHDKQVLIYSNKQITGLIEMYS